MAVLQNEANQSRARPLLVLCPGKALQAESPPHDVLSYLQTHDWYVRITLVLTVPTDGVPTGLLGQTILPARRTSPLFCSLAANPGRRQSLSGPLSFNRLQQSA